MYFESRQTTQDMFTTSLRRWAQRVVLQNFFNPHHRKQPTINLQEISIPRITMNSSNHMEAEMGNNNPTRIRDTNLNNTMYRRSHQEIRRRIEEAIIDRYGIMLQRELETDSLLWTASYIFVSKTDFLESRYHSGQNLLLFKHDYFNVDQDTPYIIDTYYHELSLYIIIITLKL